MPDYQKAAGIGDYSQTQQNVAPGAYNPEGFLAQIELERKAEINTKVAVKQWQERLHKAKVEKNPEKYGREGKKPLPGPGQYQFEESQYFKKGKNFQMAGKTAFNVGEDKVVDKYDKTQLVTMDNPGAGEYKVMPKPMPKRQMFTSNMMSATQRLSSGQRLHSVDYPSATTYNSNKYDTIQNPIVSGGAPNNILKLTHYDLKQKEKALNPF